MKRTGNTPPYWGSFEPEIVQDTDTYRVWVWKQSGGRTLSWVEQK